jgi:hypothetical protein
MSELTSTTPMASDEIQAQAIVTAKTLRKDLDHLLQEMKRQQSTTWKLFPVPGGRHLALSITHLEDSIMRLGMVLKDIGTPTPYPNSYNPENTIVDPTADGLKL